MTSDLAADTASTASADAHFPPWDAACRGSSLFIAAMHETPQQRRDREHLAKQMCLTCAGRRECLDYALRVRETLGVWGGKTSIERRDLYTD